MKTTALSRLVFMAALALATAASAHAAVPLVVAVDTSRSLTAADLALVRETAAAQLRQLPAVTQVGLVAFNDEARWLAGPGASPAEAVAALDRLQPAGNFTVLHDALFVIARELGQGGVIFLISDGRDENSATTVEDVARLCSDANVRIVAASLGRRVDERALRRITLLTEGAFAGRLPGAEAAAIAAAIDEARTAVAAATPPPAAVQQPPAEPPTATRVPEQAEASPEQAGGLPRWLIPLGAAVLLLIVVVVWLMLRQQRRDEAAYEDVGYPFQAEPEEQTAEQAPPPPPELEDLAADDQPVAAVAVPEESVLDPKVFQKEPLPEGFERTMVLDEHPVLIVRQTGRPPRSYTLPRDQVFAVGRAPKVNTLQVEEPTVSAQHFKVVPKEGEFYVVDLDTTNGTSVNHQKVKVRKLSPGDVINAGTVDFEFKLSLRHLT